MTKKSDIEKRISMDIPLPEDIIKIKNIFKEHGHKIFLVGGAVRDAALGEPIKDYDLATDAVPDKVQQMLAPTYKTLETGKAFGVINVFTPTGEFEIATFRKDLGSSDGRRPDSVEFTNLEQDVFRRDLTINSLAYDIELREIIDFTGGLDDLKNKIIRTVGNPADRFAEDRLRILRTIRFCARFGAEIDSSVDVALRANSSLQGISHERIRDEFLKGIKSAKSVTNFFKLLREYNLLHWVFGHLQYIHDFIEDKDYICIIAYIIQSNTVRIIKKELNRLTYTIDEINKISFLVNFHNFTIENAFKLKKAYIHSRVEDFSLIKFSQWRRIDENMVKAFINWNLSINGDDLLEQGFNGPALGQEIERLEKINFQKLLQ